MTTLTRCSARATRDGATDAPSSSGHQRRLTLERHSLSRLADVAALDKVIQMQGVPSRTLGRNTHGLTGAQIGDSPEAPSAAPP
jgi:hypothetical protein